MTEFGIFILADQALRDVVAQTKPDQWDMSLPEWFQTGRTQTNPSLRDIVNYHAYDEAWIPDVLAGKTAAEVGQEHDGDLLGADPVASFTRLTAAGVAAVRALTIADLDRTAHLSYGDYPVREYLKHITSFRGFRAYDIAKVIGADTKLPDDLVQGLWDEITPEAEQWRSLGVYAPAVPVPESAPLQDRLLGLVGRDPKS
jgi:hypothetical protein